MTHRQQKLNAINEKVSIELEISPKNQRVNVVEENKSVL
jgi:hypothetical protein